MFRVMVSGLLIIGLSIVFSSAAPLAVFGEEDLRIIRVEAAVDPGDGSVKGISRDYYVNGGEANGLRMSMLLDVFRPMTIRDPQNQKEVTIRIPIGQVRVIRLFPNVAVTRLYAVESLETTPLVDYRSVMLGDAVVPRGDAAAPAQFSIPSELLFDFNQWRLRPEAREVLSTVYNLFQQSSDRDVVIEGHTCSLGNDHYNRKLSLKRAKSVADFLIKVKGAPKDRIRIAGYGKKGAIASNDTEEGRRKNRRVEIRFVLKGAPGAAPVLPHSGKKKMEGKPLHPAVPGESLKVAEKVAL